MKKILIFMAVIMFLTMIGGRAYAVPFGDGGVKLQGVLDNITNAPDPNNSSTNVLTDGLSDNMDSYWVEQTVTSMSVITLVTQSSSWAVGNTFGIYDAANPMKMVQVFDSSTTVFGILEPHNVITFFIPCLSKFRTSALPSTTIMSSDVSMSGPASSLSGP